MVVSLFLMMENLFSNEAQPKDILHDTDDYRQREREEK